MIIAMIVLLLAEFTCFIGGFLTYGYIESHNKTELKQGLLLLFCGLLVVTLCCLYLARWEKSLGPVDPPVEYPTVLEFIYE